MFVVIVNSADHHETRKDLLWPIAFDGLREEIGYLDFFSSKTIKETWTRFAA